MTELADPPDGSGEHLHVVIEKRDCSTEMLAKALAKACDRPPAEIGWAGRKDRHAVTTQALTIRLGEESALANLADYLPPGASAQVLQVTRHGRKLRPGYLRGNRFRLGCADVDDPQALEAALVQLCTAGMANGYGPQRYGRNGSNLSRALAVAAGEARAPRKRHEKQRLADAAQAAVVDAVIAGRREAGTLRLLQAGDVAAKPGGACFLVTEEELSSANERLERGELVTTAPLPGTHCLATEGGAADAEASWAQEAGIELDWFTDGALRSRGGRREALVYPSDPALEVEGDTVWLNVTLPPGSFATVLLAELGISVPEERGERPAPTGDAPGPTRPGASAPDPEP